MSIFCFWWMVAKLSRCAQRSIIVLLLPLLYFSACFPVGIPEYYSGLGDSKPETDRHRYPRHSLTRPAALVVVPKSFYSSRTSTKLVGQRALGNQYLLGFLPFTRLYLQHGLDSFLGEALLDVLIAQGFAPYLVEEANALRVLTLVAPRLIIYPAIEDFSLNAFDAFFFRVLSIGGELKLDFLDYRLSDSKSVGELAVKQQKRVSLSEKRYKSYGYGLALSALFESRLKSALHRALSEYSPNRRPVTTSDVTEKIGRGASAPFVEIAFPVAVTEFPPALGAAVSASYGYPGLPAFSQRSLLRIVQRGIESAMEELGVAHLSSFGSSDDSQWLGGGTAARLWQLRTEIVALQSVSYQNKPGLRLVLNFDLSEVAGRSITELIQVRCELTNKLPIEVDGFWVLGLEEAAAHLVTAMLSGPKKDQSEVGITCGF